MGTGPIPVNVNISSGVEGVKHINDLVNDLKDLRKQGAKQIPDPTGKMRREVRKTAGAFDKLNQSLRRTLSVAAAIAGVRQIIRATVQYQKFNVALENTLGTTKQAAEAIKFLREEAERLGLSFPDLVQSFTQFAASTRGTLLEGQQTREIFSSIAEAARVMGLSVADTNAIFRALTQIVSKGTVQAEELRNQLGDRLAGAFQIASRSIGLTTEELDKQLRLGQVIAEDFLPAFAREVRSTFALGLPQATKTAAASFERLANAGNELAVSLGESGLIDAISGLADGLTHLIRFVGPPTLKFFNDLKNAAFAVAENILGDSQNSIRISMLRIEENLRAEISGVNDIARLAAGLVEAQSALTNLLGPGGELTKGVSPRRSTVQVLKAKATIRIIEARIAELRSATDPEAPDSKPPKPPSAKVLTARRKFNKALLEVDFEATREGNRRLIEELQRDLKDRLITIQEFANERTRIERETIDKEIALKRERIKIEGSRGGSEEEELRGKAAILRLEADIAKLNSDRVNVGIVNSRKAAEGERVLVNTLKDVREELRETTGTATAENRKNAIAREFENLREVLVTRADAAGVELVDNLVNVRAAAEQFEELERVLRQGLGRIANRTAIIDAQRSAGLLTDTQARERIIALQKESASVIKAALPDLEAAAAVLGPEAQASVEAWTVELVRASLVIDEIALRLQGEVTDAFTQLFDSFADSTKSATDIFKDFVRTVISGVRRLAAEKLSEKIVGKLSSGGGGGIFGFFSRIFQQGFGSGELPNPASNPLPAADGGLVTGPGTSTSDSIPARLSSGEYVVNAAAVRSVGAGLLENINAMRAGPTMPSMRFASGGLVPPAAPAGGSLGGGVRVVNVVDPRLAQDYLESSAGEKVVLNIIRRNRGSVQQVLT